MAPRRFLVNNPCSQKATAMRSLQITKGPSEGELLKTATWCGAGAMIFPLMSLTPHMTILNIWAPRLWVTDKYITTIQDPFFRFLSGMDTSYSDFFGQLFPRYEFGLHLGDPGTRPAFPPPFLKVMTNVTFDHTGAGNPSDNHPMVNRLSVLPPTDMHELLIVTLDMGSELGVVRDDEGWIIPSFVTPSAIAKATPELFISVRKYLERIRPLNIQPEMTRADWTSTIDWLAKLPLNDNVMTYGTWNWEKLDTCTRPFRNCLANALLAAQTEIVAHCRQDITSSLVEFIALGNRARTLAQPRVATKSLAIIHPASSYIERDLVLTDDGENFALCITGRFEFLTDLEMILRLHNDNRRDIYQDFSPAGCFLLRGLTITVEGLWGPVGTVFTMLEKNQRSDEGDDDSDNGRWSEKRKAVERIPPALETLRLVDWFAEYCPELPKDKRAVVEDRNDWEVDDLGVNDRTNSTLDASPFYIYSTIRGDGDPTGIYNPSEPSAFSRRYIDGLEKGLTNLCIAQPPTHNRHFLPARPLLCHMRPSLRTIEFVYTLQSTLPGLEDSLSANSADNQWRS